IFTDVLSMLMLSVMNTNERKNHTFELEQPALLLLVFAVQFLIIFIFAYGGNKLYFTLFDPEDCIIITSSQRSLNEVIKGIRKYKLQYKVTKVADYRDINLKEYINQRDTVFIYDVPIKERTAIVEYCYQNMKNVFFNPDMHDVIETNSKHIILDDVSMLGNISKGLTLEQKIVKRISDIVISVLALIVTSPILLVATIAIKIEDGGSIIFKQNRATRGGKIFSVYKLRTMKEDVENYSVVENDDRVTKVGGFLRKYRIDEIPQFVNVLKGDMSVVGPRPEMLANIFNYTSVLPEFEYRLRVKAGITGYAQIAGKYNTSPKDKLILDLMYIEEYSLWLDIKLLFQTALVILKKDSTEGFKKEEELVFEEYVPATEDNNEQ
ncbi:MAG: sugar transferase, partial [Lachnospiraceae bacterium]|nr:sugar transferase [Lachnospiraceae bacterium]